MKFDIVFVTYNSEKWIDNCLNSILKSDYDLKNVSLYFCDNASRDNTVYKLNDLSKKYKDTFNDFQVIESYKNKGFGYGNNMAAEYGKAPYIFFLNVDTEIHSDTLSKIEKEISNSNEKVGMWELKQEPYEHPKYFNPITGETSWASGACMIVKRDIFKKIGGFDTKIFMYCEDVEISWNVRKHGYSIKYLYNVPITHYSYEKPNEFKYTQFVYAFISNWYLRSKYGKFRNFLRGCLYMYQTGFRGKNIPEFIDEATKKKIKKSIKKDIFLHSFRNLFINIFHFNNGFKPSFVNRLDYEFVKEGPFYIQPEIDTNPLVSIIVRTCNRPDTLRENLISLRNQTYKNIEVVVVEDGKNTAEEMIKKEFSDLNIVYEATGNNVGRSKVANIAMEKAKGKYLNFLDDDDLFYPDHVETLVKVLEKNNYDIVYASSFETLIEVLNKSPYKYEIKGIKPFGQWDFSRLKLYKYNLFPIQSVMFKKELVNECGGIDENIDALEDWDFWIRLSLNHEFYRVEKTTSIFRTPANQTVRTDRNEFLASTLKYLDNKFKNYKPTITVEDINKVE